MRILIFHGYLLRGTGSNIYNAELVRALARLGHEVHLFCQDPDWEAPEGVTVHVPDIGRVLPVYVADSYDGFDAKVYPDLTDAELEHYIEANVEAVRAAPVPDAALVGFSCIIASWFCATHCASARRFSRSALLVDCPSAR